MLVFRSFLSPSGPTNVENEEVEEVAVEDHKAEEADGHVVDVVVVTWRNPRKPSTKGEPNVRRLEALAHGVFALRRPCRAVNGGSGKKEEGAVRSKLGKRACLSRKFLLVLPLHNQTPS